jgi:hypothetical protein
MKSGTILPVILTTILVYCAPRTIAQDLSTVQSDLTAVQSEIKMAQAEDARYAGGLVKSLIASRIVVLRQTEAMLEQKLISLKQSIPLRYTVDGKVFSLPTSATQMLADVEREISASDLKIHQQEAEVARYSGGLVQAMAMSTLATMRQTHAMLEQKRVSLKYGLPQYLGFADASSKGPPISTELSEARSVPGGPGGQSRSDPLLKALSLTVTAKGFIPSDPSSGRYEDLLTLKCSYQNTSDRDIRAFTGAVIFQDLFGKEILRASITISNPIKAGQQATWDGTLKYNQFTEAHQRFRGTELQDLKVVWQPASIIFADGTRIGEGAERN